MVVEADTAGGTELGVVRVGSVVRHGRIPIILEVDFEFTPAHRIVSLFQLRSEGDPQLILIQVRDSIEIVHWRTTLLDLSVAQDLHDITTRGTVIPTRADLSASARLVGLLVRIAHIFHFKLAKYL